MLQTVRLWMGHLYRKEALKRLVRFIDENYQFRDQVIFWPFATKLKKTWSFCKTMKKLKIPLMPLWLDQLKITGQSWKCMLTKETGQPKVGNQWFDGSRKSSKKSIRTLLSKCSRIWKWCQSEWLIKPSKVLELSIVDISNPKIKWKFVFLKKKIEWVKSYYSVSKTGFYRPRGHFVNWIKQKKAIIG